MLKKAFICPFDGTHTDRKHASAFYVPFNPTELTIEEAIGLSDVDEQEYRDNTKSLLAGRSIGWQSPVKGSSKSTKKSRITLSMTLFFNTLTSLYQESYEDVRKYIKKLYFYDNREVAKDKKPQQIFFEWGTISVAGILTRMQIRYTMFSPDGTPVRAQAEISIAGWYYGEKEQDAAAASGSQTAGTAFDETIQVPEEGLGNWKDSYKVSGNPRLRLGDASGV